MEEIAKLLEAGNHTEITEVTARMLSEGISAADILNEGLLLGMGRVGVKFRDNVIYLPDVLLAARAMKAATEVLAPHLKAGDLRTKGIVVLGTVRGDLHDIGKNLLKIMLEGSGYEVVDLGTNVAPEKFVEEAKKQDAVAIAMSALLTTTMGAMGETIRLLRSADGGSDMKVLVGGAPVTQGFCAEIGADGYGTTAPHGVEVLDRLLAP